jgi:hypothetical protein
MNLMKFLGRGIARTGGTQVDQMAEAQRAKWIDALLVDQTRAWMHLGESDRHAVVGLQAPLTLAIMCHLHRRGNRSSDPEIRMIRGALSAVDQCVAAGSVITAQHAQAFSVAAGRAKEIFQRASTAAIVHAAVQLQALVNQQEGA